VTVSGTAEVNRLFLAENPSNVWFESFTIRGNSIATHSGDRGAILFLATGTARGPVKNFGLRDIALENFRQDYWVSVENASRYDMQDILIDHPVIQSRAGNDRGAAAIGVPSAIFGFRGEEGGTGGLIRRVTLIGADADGEFVKTFAVIWSGTREFRIEHNVLRRFGAHAEVDTGGYALLTYDSARGEGTPPTAISITDNTIVAPRSCGWYGAGAVDVHVNHNLIVGQSDGADGSLPKGAIAFNGTTGEAIGNTLRDNRYGIEIAGAPGDVLVRDNAISSTIPQGKGIVLNGAKPGTDPVITLDNNSVVQSGEGSHALLLLGASSEPLGTVDVRGGRYEGTYSDILMFDGDRGGVHAGAISIANVTLAGAPSNGVLVSYGASLSPIAVSKITRNGTTSARP
jgi:hypothetical protein